MAFPTGWSRLARIQVDHTKVSGSGNLSNFPALIKDGNLPANVYSNIESDGKDLRFTTDSAGTTEVPFEIVSITPGSSLCEIWIKIPTLYYDDNTSIYVWGNNSGATAYAATDTYGSQAVWSAYGAVYHLQSLTADSSPNARTLTNNNSVASAAAKIGDGADFGSSNSNKSLNIASNIGVLQNGSITMSGWIKRHSEITTGDQSPFGLILATGQVAYFTWYQYNSGTYRFYFDRARLNVSNHTITSDFTMGTNWVHLALTYNGSTLRAYINGSEVGDVSTSGTGTGGYTNNFEIGKNPHSAGRYWSGITDNIKVIAAARSADWIATEYNNQNDPSTFWSEDTSSSFFLMF